MNWRKAVGACAAALIAAGGSALVATSATADVLGTIEADRDGGTVTDNPFAVLTTSGKCPGFGLLVLDKAADPVEIPSDPSRWIAPFSAGDGDTQHTITPGKSMAEARSDLSDGMWELRALCATDDGSAIAGHFALPIRITGQDWEVVQVQATTTELAVTPAGPVEEGTEITLTATVTPAEAAGTVSFRAGGTALGEAEVSGGTATLTTSELPAGKHALTAEFTPDDPERYSSSSAEEVPLTVTAAAGGDEDPPGPVFSVVDADGNELGPDPELAPGQTITITAPGFDADETVNLKLTTEPYGDPAPDPAQSPAPSASPSASPSPEPTPPPAPQQPLVREFEAVVADARGVLELEFTVPEDLVDGDHLLTMTGADSGTVKEFAFHTGKRPATQTPPPDDRNGPGTGNGGAVGGGGSGGNLAKTGAALSGIVATGALLTAVGYGLMRSGSHRRMLRFGETGGTEQ